MYTSLRNVLASVVARLPSPPRQCCRLSLEQLSAREVPVTDLYVPSPADSGPGTLRAALAAIVDNDPTTIHIQVEEIVLESALTSPETGAVEIHGETQLWTEIHPTL